VSDAIPDANNLASRAFSFLVLDQIDEAGVAPGFSSFLAIDL
jgi:hypothetical protein